MVIIPVIDLLQGQVVHAVLGQRKFYQPVQSRLCSGSNPVDIVQAFLAIHAFKIIYIADLDLILGTGDNNYCMKDLRTSFADINFWLDAGKGNLEAIHFGKQDHMIPVIGSETGVSSQLLSDIVKVNPQTILSLDFRDQEFIGGSDLLEITANWPENIIIMNLARIGSCLGPNIDLIRHIQDQAGNRNIYIGGGVRNFDDLLLLESMKITGVLLATALHNRTITDDQIARFRD
jgi:phosphoribosylformimino-5-aminoimidazole carboxamide ribotide isomerase